MVRRSFLSASPTGVTQEATLLPFNSTVQARHWPSPQPYLVPVSFKSSRKTSSKGRCGSVVTVRDCPLTVKVMVESIRQMRSVPARYAWFREEYATGDFDSSAVFRQPPAVLIANGQ